MADASTWLVDIRCSCVDCEWSYSGKNGMGLASQHADREGHTVKGEVLRGMEVNPEP